MNEALVLMKRVKLSLHLYLFNNEMLELWSCRISDNKQKQDKEF